MNPALASALTQARAELRAAQDRLRLETQRERRTRQPLPAGFVLRLNEDVNAARARVAALELEHKAAAAPPPRQPEPSRRVDKKATRILIARLFQVAIEARLYVDGVAPLQSVTRALADLDAFKPGWDVGIEELALPVEGDPEPGEDVPSQPALTDDEVVAFADERRAAFDAPAVAARFGVAPGVVTGMLQRLATAGRLTRLMRGLYVAPRITTRAIEVDEGAPECADVEARR